MGVRSGRARSCWQAIRLLSAGQVDTALLGRVPTVGVPKLPVGESSRDYLHPPRCAQCRHRDWCHRCLRVPPPRRGRPEPSRGLRRRVRAGDSAGRARRGPRADRKSTRLNSSHLVISYAVFCLKKKIKNYFYILITKKKKKKCM